MKTLTLKKQKTKTNGPLRRCARRGARGRAAPLFLLFVCSFVFLCFPLRSFAQNKTNRVLTALCAPRGARAERAAPLFFFCFLVFVLCFHLFLVFSYVFLLCKKNGPLTAQCAPRGARAERAAPFFFFCISLCSFGFLSFPLFSFVKKEKP